MELRKGPKTQKRLVFTEQMLAWALDLSRGLLAKELLHRFNDAKFSSWESRNEIDFVWRHHGLLDSPDQIHQSIGKVRFGSCARQ